MKGPPCVCSLLWKAGMRVGQKEGDLSSPRVEETQQVYRNSISRLIQHLSLTSPYSQAGPQSNSEIYFL